MDSSTDSSHSLARVITEMRDEIKKLEAENRELRGRRAAEENPYLTLRRNPSAPALKGQNKHSAGGEEGKVTNRHSLQEYVHKNAKVKTVTFLLPVDDIYTNRPVLTKHQDGSKITELASITETDS
uniref:Uncharacterized protein n=1 Tax=Mola mola TaxID=94237 RepID=A0A3Q3WFI1_MOLML